MTVLSRLLFGTMRVTTYDWTKPDNGSSSVPPSRRPYSDPSIDGRAPAGPPGLAIRGRAQQVACETLTAPEQGSRMVLYPNSGRIKMKYAFGPAVILLLL